MASYESSSGLNRERTAADNLNVYCHREMIFFWDSFRYLVRVQSSPNCFRFTVKPLIALEYSLVFLMILYCGMDMDCKDHTIEVINI
jgi:hypothetical protein